MKNKISPMMNIRHQSMAGYNFVIHLLRDVYMCQLMISLEIEITKNLCVRDK